MYHSNRRKILELNHQSYHLWKERVRRSPHQPTVMLTSPNIENHVQIPRANLKRGRPNIFQNGLRCDQSASENENASEIQSSTFIVSGSVPKEEKKTINNDETNDLKKEQWVCDNFRTPNNNDDSMLNSSKTSAKTSTTKAKPARKRLNMNFDVTPTNQQSTSNSPRSANISAVDTMKTPMLPSRLQVVKKTPAKTPHSSVLTTRNFTPLWQQEQQQVAGRASIARLRSQNAGRVMAKAKLFDDLVADQPNTRKISDRSNTIANQENKPLFDATIRNRLNQSQKNSPRRSKVSLSGVNRRQLLRAQRHTPIKKTPICLDKSLVSMTGISTRITRNTPSPSMQSPTVRRMKSIDTPHASLIMKPPRRINTTPQSKRKL